MPRLIDADAIISFIDAGHLQNPLELAWSDNDVVDMIESRPTIDAVPVVHGEWIKHNNPNYSPFDNSGEYLYQCNKCGMVEYRARRYCPNCGAVMDGKDGAE